MIEKVKTLLEIADSSQDILLTLLIEQATEEAVAYTNNSATASFENAIINMVIYNYNRRGTESLASESYSGVSFSYLQEYPSNITNILNKYRKVIMC